ncbi:unnamed protein product, partial [Iphiclides podalirius]
MSNWNAVGGILGDYSRKWSGKPKTAADARLSEKRRKDDLADLLATILEYSTIMPFKWYANKYMCFYCCCPFLDSESLKRHTGQEHRGPKPPSLLRAVVGYSRIKLDLSEAKAVCAKCRRPWSTLEELLEHVRSHGERVDERAAGQLVAFRLSDEGMRCVDCGQRYRFFGPLLAHAHRLHNKTAAYLCEICGQAFVAKANVDSHVRSVHTTGRAARDVELRCPKCPEVLRSRYLRKRHLALVHDVKSAQFACAQCPKVFTEMSNLVQHNARVHLRERAFACDICGFRVFSGDLLRRHMVRHDDSRPYQCEFCKKCFQRQKTLEFHRRIHTNDRRYACEECGKAFVQVTSLKLHARVHHGRPGGAK